MFIDILAVNRATFFTLERLNVHGKIRRYLYIVKIGILMETISNVLSF